MKKFIRVLVPLLLAVLIIASIGWYLFTYDRGFTRDFLLTQARYNDLHGNSRLSSWFYDLAYNFSNHDENVAIELANLYKADDNYTKAEYTLTNAINSEPSAELFTNLDKLREGDIFLLRILDEVLTYEVDQILIVEPQEVGALQIVEGQDYCTLVTCTPYGINTHRLLVRGHRIDNVEEAKTVRVTADAVQIEPLLVAPIVAIPILLLLLILLLLPKRPKTKHGGEADEED